MARDYASKSNNRKQATRSGDGLPGWLWAIIGMAGGLCIAGIAYIALVPVEKDEHPEPQQTQEAPAKPAKKPQKAAATPRPSSPPLPPEKEARFSFYKDLPEQEVEPDREAYKVPEQKADSPQQQYNYVLQAGSFVKEQDAERHRARINLLGMEAKVRKVQISGTGTRYRVQIGPSKNSDQLQSYRRRLIADGIDSYLSRAD